MSRPKDVNPPSPWNVRIWDVEHDEWLCESDPDVSTYYGFDIRGGEVAFIQGIEWVYRYSMQEGHPVIWERSTGWCDKNGVEIYEGDILRYKFTETFASDELPSIVVYSLKNARYYIVSRNKQNSFPLAEPLLKRGVEVIGNIHESPELLNSRGQEVKKEDK